MDEDILTIMRIIVARMDGKIKDLGRFKGPMASDARIILFPFQILNM